RQMRMKNTSVFDRPVRVERSLAHEVVDAVDRRVSKWLQILRFQRRGVAALVVQHGAVDKECRASVAAAVETRITRRNRIGLLDGDKGIRRRRASEGGEKRGIVDVDLCMSKRG